ncbi:MAG: helix-turn-helix domain-containing protein [Cyanobacteriota bacterium]|nr:helix-turn-helix domain-containing protein [Cyanobacteriota bacterium]
MLSNDLSLVYGLLAVILVFVGIIGFLRFLFATIYAKGNAKDTVLLELMERAGIPNWQTLQQKSGVSTSVIWMLRDGQGYSVKLSELADVADALVLPLSVFLKKLDLVE